MGRGIRRLVDRALDLALPARCVGCGREGEPVCARCEPALRQRVTDPPGTPLGMPSDLPDDLVQLEWCAPFAGVVRDALHALKYAGERRLAMPLGRAMADRWRYAGAGGDLIVPVPVHRERAARRGYDQAVLLASVVAESLRLPMVPAVERWQATIAQFDLDRRARATNVATAFRLRGAVARAAQSGEVGPAAIRGRWVVLIDDVTTTGATLSACARPLLDAGAIAVSALTMARER